MIEPLGTNFSEILINIQTFALTHLPAGAAYMCPWTRLSLVQVMACHLLAAKPLPEPMLVYCQLDSWEQISMKFQSEFYNFHSRNFIWKSRLPKWQPFCPGGDELKKLYLKIQSAWATIFVQVSFYQMSGGTDGVGPKGESQAADCCDVWAALWVAATYI